MHSIINSSELETLYGNPDQIILKDSCCSNIYLSYLFAIQNKFLKVNYYWKSGFMKLL